MKKCLCIVLMGALTGLAFGQTGIEFPEKATKINDFVPRGWKIIKKAEGDLNQDKLKDVVLIVEENNKNNIKLNENLGPNSINLNPRYLLVLFQENSHYRLVAKNTRFIPTENSEEVPCLLDPLAEREVSIEKGTLQLNFKSFLSCGSWSSGSETYVFKYQQNKFALIGFDSESFARNSGEMSRYSVNFVTKKKKSTTGMNMFEENQSKPVVKWSTFKINKLLDLDEMSTETVEKFMGSL